MVRVREVEVGGAGGGAEEGMGGGKLWSEGVRGDRDEDWAVVGDRSEEGAGVYAGFVDGALGGLGEEDVVDEAGRLVVAVEGVEGGDRRGEGGYGGDEGGGMGPWVPSQEALKSPETKEMLCLGGDEEPPRPM